jgi:uncharacterized protein YjiS (DUF1127 family)
MSLINLFVAARNAFGEWRRRQRAFDELMALDDRSLSDIGLHRSQIPALIEGMYRGAELVPVNTGAIGPRTPRLIAGHR